MCNCTTSLRFVMRLGQTNRSGSEATTFYKVYSLHLLRRLFGPSGAKSKINNKSQEQTKWPQIAVIGSSYYEQRN